MEWQNSAVVSPEVEVDPSERVWPTFNHEIGLTEAREQIGRYKRANPGSISASAFTRVAFERILGQEGCAGIRAYYALRPDGIPTLVLVGVDEFGNDMDDGELSEETWPCPPICPIGSALDS